MLYVTVIIAKTQLMTGAMVEYNRDSDAFELYRCLRVEMMHFTQVCGKFTGFVIDCLRVIWIG